MAANRRRLRSLFAALPAVVGLALPLSAQTVLDRSPNLDAAWTGAPGSLYVTPPMRFRDAPGDGLDLVATPTLDLAFALPRSMLLGVRFASASAVAPAGTDEWEPYARWTPLHEARGALVEAGATVAYNSATASVDGALSLARWLGPLRLLAEGRVMSDPATHDDVELAAGGGAVWHVLAGRLPVALAGDWATLLDRPDAVEPVWSAGLQIGVPFTANTLSLHATNAATTTIEGRSFGGSATRYGFELTIPLGIGSLLGMYAPREQALRAVVGNAEGPVAHRARIARYLFAPQVVEIAAGEVVEWTNVDAVVHTVNAEDGSWHSGAIESGATWRARFDEPGRYPFFCGPHPFMKGVVVVRARRGA